MFHRRDILKAALTAAALPALKLPAFAKPPRRFIDIHCHFSNAADLPIRGFLQRVVMSDYSAGQAQTLAGSISLSVWKGLAAKLADTVLKYETPTSQEELTCLNARASACTRSGASASQTRGVMRGLKSGLAAPAGGKTIADVLVEHYSGTGPQPKSGTRGLQMADHGDDTDAFVDFVLKEMESSGRGCAWRVQPRLEGLGLLAKQYSRGDRQLPRQRPQHVLALFHLGRTAHELPRGDHRDVLFALRPATYAAYPYGPGDCRLQLLAAGLFAIVPEGSGGAVKRSVVAPAPADARLRGLRSAAGGQVHAESAIGARHRPRGGDEARLPWRETLFADGLQAHGQCRARPSPSPPMLP